MNRNSILLGICMVTFNSAKVLEKNLNALKTAVKHAGISYELIIVDNNSQDDSVKLAKKICPTAKIIVNSTNMGYAAAINQAVRNCHTDWLLFLNPDTIVGKDLFVLLKHVRSLPYVRVFSPILLDEKGNITRTSYRWPTLTKEIIRLLGMERFVKLLLPRAVSPLPISEKLIFPDPIGESVIVDYVAGAALFIQKKVWEDIGPFDEHFFLYHEEMEWCYRASQKGIQVFVFPNYKVVHYSERSSTRRPEEIVLWKYSGLLYFYEKHKSVYSEVILRIVLIVSFGLRSMFQLFKRNRSMSNIYKKVVKVSLNLEKK